MKERKLFTICLSFIIVLFVVTFFLGGYFPGISGPSEIERSVPDGGSVVAAGRVYRREQKSDYQILYLKNVSVYYQEKSFKESRLIIYDEEKERIGIGNRIVVKGEVSYFDPAGNPGNFDRKFYYQKQKIHVSVWSDTVRVANGGVYPVRNALADIREHWKEVLISYAGEEDGSILCAVILGDKSGMEEEMKELYQKNGIAHILAISGLHLSFAGTVIYRLLRKCSGSYLAGGCAGLLFMALYILMIGVSVSALRAVIMYMFRVGADMSGRVYDGATAIAAAMLTVIIWRPLSFYDAGFQLSFGAVVGMMVLSPLLSSKKKSNNFLKNGFITSFSINLATFPMILYHFYEIPLYSVFLNLAVIPLMSVLLAAGMAGSACVCICPPVGMVFIKVCSKILWVYEVLCKGAEKLPLNRIITGQPKICWIVLYYMLLFLGVAAALSRKKEKDAISDRIFVERRAAVLSGGFLGVMLIFLTCPAVRHDDLEVTMLDVGQGDCIFLRNEKGISMLVDGGSSDVKQVGKYRIEPFLEARGAGCLDYVFISHGDADHRNGVEQLLERQEQGVKVNCLVLPEKNVWDEGLEELAGKAVEQGTKVVILKQGDKIEAEGLVVTCLLPERNYAGEKGNEASMVLDIRYGYFDMLLTGDLGAEGERRLAQNHEKDYDVLKVAHHGSDFSSDEEFLSAVKPEVALVSAGKENRYGHPGKETIARLKNAGCRIYCTKETGAVILKTDGKTIAKPEIFKYNGSYEKFE